MIGLPAACSGASSACARASAREIEPRHRDAHLLSEDVDAVGMDVRELTDLDTRGRTFGQVDPALEAAPVERRRLDVDQVDGVVAREHGEQRAVGRKDDRIARGGARQREQPRAHHHDVAETALRAGNQHARGVAPCGRLDRAELAQQRAQHGEPADMGDWVSAEAGRAEQLAVDADQQQHERGALAEGAGAEQLPEREAL